MTMKDKSNVTVNFPQWLPDQPEVVLMNIHGVGIWSVKTLEMTSPLLGIGKKNTARMERFTLPIGSAVTLISLRFLSAQCSACAEEYSNSGQNPDYHCRNQFAGGDHKSIPVRTA